jgi:photosystem II stability/assembly factor-like uncharacterized protein
MMMLKLTTNLGVVLLTLGGLQSYAQESTTYAVVTATKLFVVGAANPRTGVFFQHPAEDTSWHHTGPNNIRAFGFAVGPNSGGRVMYIAAGNGLHKTTDGGEHWRITTGWDITEVLWVSPDPQDQNSVYIATPYGIFKTVDGCATWKRMNQGLSSTFTPCVIVDNADSRHVYCVTEDGAYGSDDGALTWKRLGLSVPNTRVIVQHPKDPKTLAVGTEENGIYISNNGGKWWTKRESGIDHQTFYAIAFDPGNPDVMYAGGYVTGVYKSIDAGNTWKRVNNGLTAPTVHSLAVDPGNSSLVYAACYWGGVFRSDNGGGTWRNVGMPESQIWTLFIQPK